MPATTVRPGSIRGPNAGWYRASAASVPGAGVPVRARTPRRQNHPLSADRPEPRGTLREVLAYPLKVDGFGDEAFAHALERLRLERLLPMLDTTRRWDRELSQDEQLSLAFARMVLQKPPWVLIDDTLGSLDDESHERVVEIFNDELKRTSLIHIGRAAQARDPLFSWVLHLVKTPPKPPTPRRRADDAKDVNSPQESTSGET